MRRTNGFTLVEIVVALTLLSMLTLLLLASMRMLGDSQRRLEYTVERVDEMRLVTRFLRNSIQQAFPLSTARSTYPYFEGGHRELRWVAPLRGAEGFAGLHFMRLYREKGGLAIQFVPYAAEVDEPDWLGARSFPLLDAIDRFAVDYREERGEPWVEEWGADAFTPPPAWVRLRLQVRGRYWPDVVVALDQLR